MQTQTFSVNKGNVLNDTTMDSNFAVQFLSEQIKVLFKEIHNIKKYFLSLHDIALTIGMNIWIQI